MKIIYDTGSHWTWVQMVGCQGKDTFQSCTKESVGYNPAYSEYVQRQQERFGDSDERVSLAYGVGFAQGFLVTDRICLDEEA